MTDDIGKLAHKTLGTIGKRTIAVLCWLGASITVAWTLSWFEPDWIHINTYLNVKIPAAVTGIFFLFIATAIFNAVTLGKSYGGIKNDPLASAIFFGSLFIALALCLSWA
jgi:hypothetical protein